MKIAIIGGTRGLGRWIAQYLKSKKFEIVITSRDSDFGTKIAREIGVEYCPDNKKAASQCRVVIIAVPIEHTEYVIREVAPSLKKGSLIMDVTSVKEMPSYLMQDLIKEGVDFLPTHPMFGPRIRSLEGQVVVLTPLQKNGWFKRVLDFLEDEKVRVLVTTPKKHDEMMSVVQVLTHFAYISIASTIEKLEVNVKESRKFASPIYNLMVDTISRIVAQNPYLAYSIQTQNQYANKARSAFIKTVKELEKDLDVKNQNKFVEAMSSAAKNLNDLEAALGRSDKAISALNQEIVILKKSIGKEVGLRHIYSGKVHIGILKSLEPDFLLLKTGQRNIMLKISNIEILDSKQMWNWKINNQDSREYDISAVFPNSSDSKVISSVLESLDGIIQVKILDTYQGPPINEGMISMTFRIKVLERTKIKEVEKLIKGFGAKIR
ncbi:prephenate dehydrogenase [Methanobacterium movens]